MHKERVDILLIALSSPLLVGVYRDGKLLGTIESDEKSSEVLPKIYKELLTRYEVESLLYANGPGSFMSIKIAYIFLKSLSILKGVPLYAVDAFYFNKNRPIKAIGKLHFVKIQSRIEKEKFSEVQQNEFSLPEHLKKEDFSLDSAPMYGIGVV